MTRNGVEARIASAKVDPTFLLADVEIVATYQLFNVNRVKLENLIHKFFEPAQFDLEMKDRFGRPYGRANGFWCRSMRSTKLCGASKMGRS